MQDDSAMKSRLEKANYLNWAVEFTSNDYLTQLKQFPKANIVYLTADSPNLIENLDENKAYIIGGIVDRNRYLNLTFDKAKEQGIAHGKLPINQFMKLNTSAVLTVNHVFEILAEQFNIKDWEATLTKVIPERKVANEASEQKKQEKLDKKKLKAEEKIIKDG